MNPTFPGAFCAIHRSAPATRTCTRCGNFMCFDCASQGDPCPTCVQLQGQSSSFPFDRNHQEGLLGYAWNAFTRDWGMLSLCAFLVMVISMGAGLIGNILAAVLGAAMDAAGDRGSAGALVAMVVGQVLGQFLSTVVSGVLSLGFARVAWSALNGGGVDIGTLFSQIHKAGRYLLQVLLLVLVIGVPLAVVGGGVAAAVIFGVSDDDTRLLIAAIGAAVLFIPLIFVLMPLYFAPVELAMNDGVGVWESIVNAWRIGSGRRLTMFAYGILSFLIILAGLLLCFLPVIPAMALVQLIFVGLYAALRNGSSATPIRAENEQPMPARPVTM